MEMRARKSATRGKQVARPAPEPVKAKTADKKALAEKEQLEVKAKTLDTAEKPAAEEEEASVAAPSEEPSPEDLEEVEKETTKAINDLERNDRSMLGRYFREMANHRCSRPTRSSRRRAVFTELEVGFWRALFSHVPAFETVARVIELHVEEVPADVHALRKLAKGVKKTLTKKDQHQVGRGR